MSTKHNVNHKAKFGRGNSNYAQRLLDRGLSRTPVMRDFIGVKPQNEQGDKYAAQKRRAA